MYSPLNNRHMETKSQKLSRIVPIKNYIVDKIDENQNIKRLCRYMTTTPLMSKGKTYDGYMIDQPDIEGSLKEKVEDQGKAFMREAIVYPYSFTEDIVDKDRLTIYVHCPTTTVSYTFEKKILDSNTGYMGHHIFFIEIVYPLEYNKIEPYGEERAYSIAYEILDMLDDMYIDGEVRDYVGDCKFRIEGDILTKRLSTAEYGILTIPVYVPYVTTRVNRHLLER